MMIRRKISKRSRLTIISAGLALVFAALLIFGILSVQNAYAQPLPREETLYVAISKRVALGPKILNIYTPGFDRSRTGLHQLVMEYFFYVNLETGEYIPWLAEDFNYSADFKKITVNLRRGVKWNDGWPFNADDVIFTYDLLLENAPKMVWSAEVAAWVESIRKIDDYTVELTLKKPNPRFHLIREAFPAVRIWGGVTILPKHVWEGKDPVKFNNYPPVGTGPYRLLSSSEAAFVYERRDDWWVTEQYKVKPAPRYVVYQYFGPETSVAIGLTTNDIDSPAIGILSLGSYLVAKKKNPYVTAWYTRAPHAWLDPCPRLLMIQNARSPWDRKEVRWAISYLIDRDAIVNLAYEGMTQPSWGLYPYYKGLDPYFATIQDLIEKYPTTKCDPAKAEEIFKSLGFKKGTDDVWETDKGERLKMDFLVDSGDSEAMKVTAVIADQLRAGGIDVTVRPLTGAVHSDTRLRGKWDIAWQCFCPGDTDVFDNLELFHSKYYVPLGEPAPWYERNSFRYKNPGFDAIVDEMAVTPPSEVEKIKNLFRQAMQIWFEDLPVIPLTQTPALVPFNTAYWVGWPSAADPWNMPVNWWATFNLVISGYPSPKTGEWVGGIRSSRP
ncbi:MAG: ABC transporter substrate-binding protein [Candidatus Atribacteria bacterium]